MKPLLLKNRVNPTSSFDIRYEQLAYFANPWHYHPEFELIMVTRSESVRFVGDNIEQFDDEDLVLIGANLPHYWRSNDIYYTNAAPSFVEAIVMKFHAEAWGKELLLTPEMQSVRQLLKQAERGIHFPKKTAREVKPLLSQLLDASSADRLIGWLNVFKILSKEPEKRLLLRQSASSYENHTRVDKVINYIKEHLAEQIHLSDVAELANMNSAAFCRYFKQQTSKTFTEVLNDMRIQSACLLLIDSHKDISEISFACGFQDISYFSALFKAKQGVNPSMFRKKYSILYEADKIQC